jgi:hypothetical protein
MKKTLLLMLGLTASACFNSYYSNSSCENSYKKETPLKGPEILEVLTNYKTIKEALLATKMALMQEEFIATNGLQESSFTAKRTTGSHADYYIADVMANKEQDGTIKLTITFMKIGSGMLKLSKISSRVEQKLNTKSSQGNSDSPSKNNTNSGISKNSYLSFQIGLFPYYKRDEDTERTPLIGIKYEIGLGKRIGLVFDLGGGHHEGETQTNYYYNSWDNTYLTFSTSIAAYLVKNNKIDLYAVGGLGFAKELNSYNGIKTKVNVKGGLRIKAAPQFSIYSEFGLGLSKLNFGLSYTIK